jgi:hypothetical protein
MKQRSWKALVSAAALGLIATIAGNGTADSQATDKFIIV